MDDISVSVLFAVLVVLLILSGFFSSSETGMMSLNRYRLKHLARNGHRGARLASSLLKRTDRLIGVILVGNNFVNIAAATVAGLIATRVLVQDPRFGLTEEWALTISSIILTLVVLIFSEVTPKTWAATYPEKIAFPASYVLRPLLFVLAPFVWVVNLIANGILRSLGVKDDPSGHDHLSAEELRTVVFESSTTIPGERQQMLLSVLDLEKVYVNDIMIPRNEVTGIDIDDDRHTIVEQIKNSQHTRLPVYRDDINNVLGILHLRKAAQFITNKEFTRAELLQATVEPYFIPATTPLNQQLLNFQKEKRRFALVVDEYGDIEGLATLEDILEEIVGEFTSDVASTSKDIHPQEDGSLIIDGTATLRDINKALDWELPTDGPKTLNGLILEHLESIPENSVGLKIENYFIEILKTHGNTVKSVKITDGLEKKQTPAEEEPDIEDNE